MVESIVRPRPRIRRRTPTSPYALIIRGADGRPRIERFKDAGAYCDRLAALQRHDADALSIDDLVTLLADR
jgi:hypothetical protein